jgi:hypothetical protein
MLVMEEIRINALINIKIGVTKAPVMKDRNTTPDHTRLPAHIIQKMAKRALIGAFLRLSSESILPMAMKKINMASKEYHTRNQARILSNFPLILHTTILTFCIILRDDAFVLIIVAFKASC